MITKKDLDKRICDVEPCENTETYREFIRATEREFYICRADIDNMSDKDLNSYIEYLDNLWWK